MNSYVLLPVVLGIFLTPGAPEDELKTAKANLIGEWELKAATLAGSDVPVGYFKGATVTFDEKSVIIKGQLLEAKGSYSLAKMDKLYTIEITEHDECTARGILAVQDDVLKISFSSDPKAERPKTFESTKENAQVLFTLQRRPEKNKGKEEK